MFSDPVVGEDFFGRQDIIELIVKRARALKSGYRQNVAIIGHQQLGKTSLLRQFLHSFKEPGILAIYVEIKIQALDYFVEQFIRSLLYQCLAGRGAVSPTESLSGLSKKAEPIIPKTVLRVTEIVALLKRRHSEEAYSKLFELTPIVKQETEKNCIVILDEFHRLGDLGVRNAFSDFGKRIMVQKDTMYLLASSSFSASRKILAEKLSLLFGNFERVYLEPFDFETSFQFIQRKLSPIGISENLKNFLVAFTDGHPFFLQTITGTLRERALAKSENELSRVTIAEVFLKVLYESQGILNQYFLKLISPWMQGGSRGLPVLALTLLAGGVNKLKDIAAALNRSQSETSRLLQELMERELIIKTGVFYRFHNKMFKFWLKEVYEHKELSLLEAVGKAEDFMGRIEAKVVEHEELLKLDIADRVLGLFSLFRNDLIEFGERKRKLPYFTEIVKSQPPGRLKDQSFRKIVAKGHGACWVCKIVEQKATEKEVLELVQGVSPGKKEAATKVLLAFRGVDDNAKLLAKEKKVFTLGLSKINALMEVYGAAPIIVAENDSPAAAKA